MAESASRLVLWLAASAGALSPSPRARSLPARAVRAPAGLSLQPLAPRARALTRRASDMERSYDGVDLTASDATDVMDEEGWFEEDDERDARERWRRSCGGFAGWLAQRSRPHLPRP